MSTTGAVMSGSHVANLIVWLIVLALCVWVLIDSTHLGACRGGLGGGMLDMGPAGWFFSCLLIPMIGLICYACTRPRLVTRHRALKTIGWAPDGRTFAVHMPPQPMQGYVPQRGVRPPLPT